MKKQQLLIIDDEPRFYYTFCKKYMESYVIEKETSYSNVSHKLSDKKWEWDIIILDLDLGGGYQKGLTHTLPSILKKTSKQHPILVISSTSNSQIANAVINAGATAFLSKVKVSSNPTLIHKEIQRVISRFNEQKKTHETSGFIARSKIMLDIQNRLKIMVNYPHLPVLLLGETGVGKEVAAKYLHDAKKDATLPYEAINLSAFTPNLLLSEIYGHVKGAFTGANTDKIGLFSLAKNGTLLLDEIGEIHELIQVQLLRVLEERTYKQVGGTKDLALNAHLVFATNRNLEEAIKEGSFRPDFYARIKGLSITIPPLRERKEDILPLMEYFFKKACHKKHPFYQKKVEDVFTDTALEKIHAYPWPSNIRQLASTVNQLVFEAEVQGKKNIDEYLLPTFFLKETFITAPKRERISKEENAASVQKSHSILNWPLDKSTAYDELKKIENALIQEGGRKEDAALVLGLKSDQTLRYRVKKKYFQDYPELFEDFPTICKVYKIKI